MLNITSLCTDNTMNYLSITKSSVSDGDGVRVVLWVSGCRCRCKGCHNKESWDFRAGTKYDLSAEAKLFQALNNDWVSGITFSGGHPLEKENRYTILNIIKKIKAKYPQKTIWLYTGYTLSYDDFVTYYKGISQDCFYHNLMTDILSRCDVVIDGQFIEELKDITLQFRGSSNQRIIDVNKTKQKGEITLWQQP